MKYKLYCDGSCRSNGYDGASGAYAYVILTEQEDFICSGCNGGADLNTNNRAEMTAMIKGLEYWKQNLNGEIDVFCDSAYIVNAYKQNWIKNWKANGWKTSNKQPVKNQDLWIKLDEYFQDESVNLMKVKAHNKDKWNNFVDKMAQVVSLKDTI